MCFIGVTKQVKKKILLIGGSGFIGTKIASYFTDENLWTVTILTRNKNALFGKLILEANFFHSSKLFSDIFFFSIHPLEHHKKELELGQELFVNNLLLGVYKFSKLQGV